MRKTANHDLWVIVQDKRQYKKAMRQHMICAECTAKMFDNVAALLWQQQQPAGMPELHYFCKKMVVELLTTPQDPEGPASMSLFLMRQLVPAVRGIKCRSTSTLNRSLRSSKDKSNHCQPPKLSGNVEPSCGHYAAAGYA